MTSSSQRSDAYRSPKYPGLTPLNERTSAAYQRCNGHHIPSGNTVMRQYPAGPLALPTCLRCGVPYGGPRTSWTGGTKTK